jgi:hypothetical protein
MNEELDQDLDEELDISWIHEEESLLQISQQSAQTIEKESAKQVRVEYLYVNRENCIVNKETEVAELPVLLADRVEQRKHDYVFTEAVAFIVDIDIGRLQAFTQWTVSGDTTAFGSWMVPVCVDTEFAIQPTLPIFHGTHCIYVLFQAPSPELPKSILKKTGGTTTKRVRIGHTPSYAASQRGRHTRRVHP